MEQRLFIKIRRRDGLCCKQIHLKLLELYGGDGFSYSEVCYWIKQFFMRREHVEEARKTGRLISVFSFELRVCQMSCSLHLFDALPRPRTLLY
jgi:hypothetical protein